MNSEIARLEDGKDAFATTNPVQLDSATIEEEFALSMPILYRSAARILRNTQDSEDAVQDGLLQAFSRRHQFRGQSRVSTWLYSIVRNSALMHLRRRDHFQWIPIGVDDTEEGRPRLDDTLVDARPNPEEQCADSEHRRIVDLALSRLPRNYRGVVRLCVVDGFSQKEAAKKLGVSVNAIKTRLFRARPQFIKGLRAGIDRDLLARPTERKPSSPIRKARRPRIRRKIEPVLRFRERVAAK